jgi:acyl-coenzyme A thioesterase PaaI-like protein
MRIVPSGPYSVSAYNTAKESENKIHDDATAQRFGFRGGLVPGVDVYAYMTHLPVEAWGRAWLERGSADCRFLKPVYEGSTAVVRGDAALATMTLELTVEGELCATGSAALGDAPATPPDPACFVEATPPEARPPADETSLAAGAWLGMRPLPVTGEFAANYLRDVRETDPLYVRERLVHPGMILRTGNWLLTHNVVVGPWIHVGSTINNFAPARVGQTLTARARVVANYDKKGHRFVDLDALVLADGTPVARIAHTAIYRPRQVA